MHLLLLIGIGLILGFVCYTGLKFLKVVSSLQEGRISSAFPKEEPEPVDVEFETVKH